MILEQFKFTTEELMEERKKRNGDINKFCKFELMNLLYSTARYASPITDNVLKYIKKDDINHQLLIQYQDGFYSSDSIFVPFLHIDDVMLWNRVYNYNTTIRMCTDLKYEDMLKQAVIKIFGKDSCQLLPYGMMDLINCIKIKIDNESLVLYQDEVMISITPSIIEKYSNMDLEESKSKFKKAFDYLSEYLSLDETEKEYTPHNWTDNFPRSDCEQESRPSLKD